jgi:hypothetical protein
MTDINAIVCVCVCVCVCIILTYRTHIYETRLWNGRKCIRTGNTFRILRKPKLAGSNPAEAVGFFRAKKSSARLPSEGK